MKKYLFSLILLLVSYVGFSQKGLSYQAVVLDPNAIEIPGQDISGQPLVNGDVWMKFSIYNGSTLQFEEVQKTKTDGYGLVNLMIGSVSTASFNALVWDASQKTLQVYVSFNQGASYTKVSDQKLNYNPYALYAETAEKLGGVLAISGGGTGATTAADARLNLGLDQVNNTSDATKPVSTATKAALDLKANVADVNAAIALKANTTDMTAALAAKADTGAIKSYVDTKLASGNFSSTQSSTATITDADANTKGKIQLAGDLAGTAAVPTVPGLALKANAADVTSALALKANTADVNLALSAKADTAYVISKVAAATIVDADANTKGKIQLAGDLAGTAAAPTIPALALKANAADLVTLTTVVTSNTASITAISTAVTTEATTARAAELVLTNNVAANTASITANTNAILLKAPIASPIFTGTVAIGTANPSSAAALDITSTSKGLLLPRLTFAQKSAIISPEAGLILWCSDCGTNGELQVYNGTNFVNMVGANAQFALPTISATSAASAITSSTLTSGGSIDSDGGAFVTARGVVWNTSTNPTVSLSTKTTDGTGIGTFSSSISGLTSGVTYYVRAYATNSVGTKYGPEITVNTAQAVATLASTTAASSIGATSANSGGNITYNGGATVTVSGLVWSTSSNPTIALTTKTSNGSASGTFTSNITGLTPGTLYYVRSYATNNVGTSYGAQTSFTTLNTPTISSTTAASSLTSSSAVSGGTISSDGGDAITTRGIVYGTSAGSSTYSVTSGSGTGTFTSNLTGLTPATTYYVRSFATNSVGTVYGPEISFTTIAIAPTLSTTAASSIDRYTAISGGIISSNGGSAITASGICWSTTATPTIANNITTDGTTSGTFTSSINGLTVGTIYYVRAYATNAIGTSYGATQSFTTVGTFSVLPTVGSSYGGGKVAYVYQNGDPGYTSSNIPVLIASNSNQGFSRWYNGSNITTGATSAALGSGFANTNTIITVQGAVTSSYAAGIARAYTDGIYTDWYLPSQDELNKLYINRGAIGGFDGTMNYFWSSTESSSSSAKMQNYLSSGAVTDFSKNASGGYIRAVRTINLSSANIPALATTASATSITSSSAILGGNVTDEGATQVSARGLVYGTTSNSSTYSVTIGSGAGTYTGTLTGLVQGTTYYVRSFATNTQGTNYGAEISFTTLTTPSISVTATPSSLTTTSAVGGGTISSTGGATITTSGLVWDTSSNPTVAVSTKTTDGATAGTFTSSITGLIQGTTYHVRAYATNIVGTSYGPDVTFTTLTTPSVTATASVLSITGTTATGGGTISSDGGASVTARGVVYGTSAGSSSYSVTSGTGTGSYTSSLTGLTPVTTYYIRAFATNSVGTVYGPELSFTTLAVVPTLASTETATSITTTTAISGGNITDNGGATVTTSGLVWSTTSTPTIALSTKTTDGTSTGTFTSSLTGLTAATTYYVRSYATNIAGTNYGTQTSFTTLAQAPIVSGTTTPTSVTRTTAIVGGTISSDGIPTATRGLVYGTSSGSSTYSITVGAGAGTYSTTITGLTAGTTYFVRSFASNSLGIVYGPEQTFTTTAPFSAPNIVTSGLLLNLDAANPASYSGSGTTWTNLASAGSSLVPNFTINSSATFNSTDGAIKLSTGGNAVASTTSSFGKLTSYSIEVWVKSNNLGGSFFTERIYNPVTNAVGSPPAVNMMLSYGIDMDYGDIRGGRGFNNISTGFYSGGWHSYQTTSSDASIVETWTHIIATFDETTKIIKIYKNGSLLENSTAYSVVPGNASNFGYYIGSGNWGGGAKLGDYSIVNMYNRALSPTEISTNFDAVKTRFGL